MPVKRIGALLNSGTVTFETPEDQASYLEALHFQKMNVPGFFERWMAQSWDDNGNPIVMFLSAQRGNPQLKWEFADYAVT